MRLGWLTQGLVVDVGFAGQWLQLEKGLAFSHGLPTNMQTLLERGSDEIQRLQEVNRQMELEETSRLTVEGEPVALRLDEVDLLAPLPQPKSVRDFYAFEQHVMTARQRRGLAMIPEWYEIPVFYFTNHQSIIGHEAPVVKPEETQWLDYELEIACIIGKKGRNISEADAQSYIAGFTIMNDWSARDLQRQEMAVGLGPAKGKDFATSLGPCLVTLDELEDRRNGQHWDLRMTAKVNGQTISQGNVKDLYWSFSQMIARASKDCDLYPGDVIGSGTVGTGCILELGPEVHRWIESGDVIELEIERLGVLRNTITEA
nr:fumarylacetoacetate hydrolase family protein [Hazenella coriacea]